LRFWSFFQKWSVFLQKEPSFARFATAVSEVRGDSLRHRVTVVLEVEDVFGVSIGQKIFLFFEISGFRMFAKVRKRGVEAGKCVNDGPFKLLSSVQLTAGS
jgi:hypothetical protein